MMDISTSLPSYRIQAVALINGVLVVRLQLIECNYLGGEILVTFLSQLIWCSQMFELS